MEITRTTGECLHSPVVLVIFMYGDCHGREAASRHRGSCLLLFSIWRLPWPRGSIAESRLLLVAFYVWRLPWPRGSVAASRLLLVAFYVWRLPWPRGSVAEALLLRHYLRLPINLCEPALIAFFHFYSSISSFCNLCFHSLYLSQRQ